MSASGKLPCGKEADMSGRFGPQASAILLRQSARPAAPPQDCFKPILLDAAKCATVSRLKSSVKFPVPIMAFLPQSWRRRRPQYTGLFSLGPQFELVDRKGAVQSRLPTPHRPKPDLGGISRRCNAARYSGPSLRLHSQKLPNCCSAVRSGPSTSAIQ